jgi:hypothetical protein
VRSRYRRVRGKYRDFRLRTEPAGAPLRRQLRTAPRRTPARRQACVSPPPFRGGPRGSLEAGGRPERGRRAGAGAGERWHLSAALGVSRLRRVGEVEGMVAVIMIRFKVRRVWCQTCFQRPKNVCVRLEPRRLLDARRSVDGAAEGAVFDRLPPHDRQLDLKIYVDWAVKLINSRSIEPCH